jgi:UDPglucose 6-dehydrogenase
VKALVASGREQGHAMRVLTAVEEANEAQKRRLVDKLVKRFGENLAGRHFAIWGLAFKPNTDDMREASSRVIVAELTRRGATVAATTRWRLKKQSACWGTIPACALSTT